MSTLGVSLSFEVYSLVGYFGSSTTPTQSVLWVGSLTVALLLKLLLQPLHFFLVSFYKIMPVFALTQYLFYYYTPLIVCLFFFFVSPLLPLVGLGTLLWASLFLLSFALFVGGLNTVSDVRFALAFSSMLNLGFILLAVPTALSVYGFR